MTHRVPSFAAAIILSLSIGSAAAQPPQSNDEKAAAVASVQKFFDSMAARDVDGARRILMPDARLVSVREQDGQPVSRSTAVEDYLKSLGSGKQALRERMWSPEVRVHGPIASVWTPYDFWTDGKFSHCGIDIFDLVKTSEGWKLAAVTYTVERTGCAPSPLGPLK